MMLMLMCIECGALRPAFRLPKARRGEDGWSSTHHLTEAYMAALQAARTPE